jgi:aminopeptidase N
MDPFFDGWVFNPGFPHFAVDSMWVDPNPFGYIATVVLRQRLREAPNLFEEVKVPLSFVDNYGTYWNDTIIISDNCVIQEFYLPAEPVNVFVDLDNAISDAISDETHWVSVPGPVDMPLAHFSMDVSFISDSALVRAEHNWIKPKFKTPHPGLHLADRYWRIHGLIPLDFAASAEFLYNGQNSLSVGHLDNDFISNDEDSLILMYRADPRSEWTEFIGYSNNTWGPSTDKRGRMDVDQFIPGDYVMAIYDASRPDEPLETSPVCSGISSMEESVNPEMILFPNPASDYFTIQVSEFLNPDLITVSDISGKKVLSQTWNQGAAQTSISTSSFGQGIYLIELSKDAVTVASSKVSIIR